MSSPLTLHVMDIAGPETTSSRPLVVLHGLLGNVDNWKSQIKGWAASRRVIAIDLRNHGRSPHAAGMSYAAMSADVLKTLDQLALERFDLLGHSMGGKVAISIARLAAERVAALIVADIAPVAYQHSHAKVFNALEAVARAQPATRREADAVMAAHVDTAPVRLFLATNLVRDPAQGGMTLRIGLSHIMAGYADIIGPPAGLGAYSGPALVLRGECSDYVSEASLPAVKAVLPSARVLTLEGAGHWLHAEAPEAFQAETVSFLNQLNAPAGQ